MTHQGTPKPPTGPTGADVPPEDGDGVEHMAEQLKEPAHAAAAMAQTRNMLRALLYDLRTPPSAALAQLDHTLNAVT